MYQIIMYVEYVCRAYILRSKLATILSTIQWCFSSGGGSPQPFKGCFSSSSSSLAHPCGAQLLGKNVDAQLPHEPQDDEQFPWDQEPSELLLRDEVCMWAYVGLRGPT